MTTATGIIALAALTATVSSLVWLPLQPAKLSPVRDPISQNGTTGFRAGYRAVTEVGRAHPAAGPVPARREGASWP